MCVASHLLVGEPEKSHSYSWFLFLQEFKMPDTLVPTNLIHLSPQPSHLPRPHSLLCSPTLSRCWLDKNSQKVFVALCKLLRRVHSARMSTFNPEA